MSLLLINEGADLHAVALCCLLQVVAVAPKHLAGIFHRKLDWIKVSWFQGAKPKGINKHLSRLYQFVLKDATT